MSGMGGRSQTAQTPLAAMISAKTKEDYGQVISNIRTRLSMDIMRSMLVGVRGVRRVGKGRRYEPPLYPVSPLT